MKPFIFALFVTSALLAGAVLLLDTVEMISGIPSFFLEILIFLVVTTAFLFRFVFRTADGSFIQMYLLTMVLKLLGYGAFIFFVLYRDPPNAVSNVVFFLVGYLLFTAIEIFFLHRKTRG